jgi:hypothetical protein
MRLGKIPAKSASVMFLMLSFLCVLCAFQAVPAAVAGGGLGAGILKGAVAGVLAAIFGWAAQKKDADGSHEDFDVAQAVVTAVVGAGIGAFAAWKHMSIADVENMPILGSVVMAVEIVIKIVWRNGKVSLQRALGTVQAGGGNGGGGAANPTVPAPTVPPKP